MFEDLTGYLSFPQCPRTFRIQDGVFYPLTFSYCRLLSLFFRRLAPDQGLRLIEHELFTKQPPPWPLTIGCPQSFTFLFKAVAVNEGFLPTHAHPALFEKAIEESWLPIQLLIWQSTHHPDDRWELCLQQ